MKKALLINEGYSDNLGDQAIKYTIQNLIESQNYEVDFVDFTRINKKSIKKEQKIISRKYIFKKVVKYIIPIFIYNFLYRTMWFLKNFRTIYYYSNTKKYDLVIIGGGQLILSNVLFPIAMYTWINFFKKNKNSKIIIFGVGCGTKFSKMDLWLYENSLSKVDKIFIRDFDSINFIKNKFNINSEYVPDPVFYVDQFYPAPLSKTKLVLVGIVNFDIYKRYNPNEIKEEAYLGWWEKKVLSYIEKGYDIKLFYTSDEDIDQTYKLKQILNKKYSIKLEILNIKTVHQLLDSISLADVIISARMHALIIGYAYKCKLDIFIISKKILSFKEHYIDNIKSENLKTTILNAVNHITSL